jgi:two-component system, OmpR family, sensor histidine kinase TctE
MGFVSTLVVLQLSKRASDEAYDRVLGAAALSISETVGVSESGVTVDIPHASFAILGTSGMNRIFYRIVEPGGATVTGTPVLGIDSKLLQKSETRFFDSQYRGEDIRVAQVAQFFQGNAGGGWFNIFVAETREARYHLATRLITFALLPAILAIVVGLILIVLAIRSSFLPLKKIENSIVRRNPSDMSPLNVVVPKEVEALVISINSFMARLDSTLSGLRRVTADAAHQLRTPLAAIRSMSELAIDASPQEPVKDYVQRIHTNAVSATVLANQLMTEARLLHSFEIGEVQEFNLFLLIKRVIRRTKNELKYQIKLPEITVINESNQHFKVIGNEIAIAELVKNLLENALRHGGGPIVLGLRETNTHFTFFVKDRGPGIPHAIFDTVFNRFVKDPNKKTGTGLGLAIVKQIVIAAEGDISLDNANGLIVTVRLPKFLNEVKITSSLI